MSISLNSTRSVVVAMALLTLGAGLLGAMDQRARRVRAGADVKRPKLLHKVMPAYPEDAKKRGIEGTVILEVVVATDGAVGQATVTKKVEPTLDAAAIDAVTQWRYEATERDGQPVEVILSESVPFRLKR